MSSSEENTSSNSEREFMKNIQTSNSKKSKDTERKFMKYMRTSNPWKSKARQSAEKIIF